MRKAQNSDLKVLNKTTCLYKKMSKKRISCVEKLNICIINGRSAEIYHLLFFFDSCNPTPKSKLIIANKIVNGSSNILNKKFICFSD